jgi:hypothetical protein
MHAGPPRPARSAALKESKEAPETGTRAAASRAAFGVREPHGRWSPAEDVEWEQDAGFDAGPPGFEGAVKGQGQSGSGQVDNQSQAS